MLLMSPKTCETNHPFSTVTQLDKTNLHMFTVSNSDIYKKNIHRDI